MAAMQRYDVNGFLHLAIRPQLVLIIGASAGCGLTLAHQHARYGNDLVLVARRKKFLETMKEELEENYGTRVHTFAANLSSPGSAEELFRAVKKAGLEVELLINNADFCNYDTTTSRREVVDPTAPMGTTLSTLLSLTTMFADDMAKRGGGNILNIGSAASILNDPTNTDAIEEFVKKFSKNVNKDLRSKGVRARIKNHVLRSPFSLKKFFPGDTEYKTMGNLRLRPSKHVRKTHRVNRVPYPTRVA